MLYVYAYYFGLEYTLSFLLCGVTIYPNNYGETYTVEFPSGMEVDS